MSAKIIISKKEEEIIINLINKNYSVSEISKYLNNKYSEKKLKRFSSEIGLFEKLKDNTWKKRNVLLTEFNKNRRLENMKKLESLYKEKVISLLNSGGIYKDVCNVLNVSDKQVVDFLTYIGYRDIQLLNSKLNTQKLSSENWRRNALKIKGKPLKPLSDELISEYIKLKDSGVYPKEIIQIFKDKFNCTQIQYKWCRKLFGAPTHNPQSGKLNPMYGKPTPHGSGIGVKGWILYDDIRIFFRSTLELKIYMFLLENNIEFVLSKHRIEYIFNDVARTYNPDICIGNNIFEIKPSALLMSENVKAKMNALQNYCNIFKLKCDFITEKTYDISKYTKEYILDLISKNKIQLVNESNLEKLKRTL